MPPAVHDSVSAPAFRSARVTSTKPLWHATNKAVAPAGVVLVRASEEGSEARV